MTQELSGSENAAPKVTPTNWEAFEANRDARYAAAVEENSPGFQEYNQRTRDRLDEGRRKLAARRK